MVDFIGVSRIRELLARRGTARVIEELAMEIEADFLRWESFDKSPRHATHSGVGVIELMPASDGRLYAFKYVNGHPKNTQDGLLTVTAFGVLADVQTGYPLLLSELTLTTALRTAATSALAARRMARAGSRVMALIGNGAQGEFQVIGFHQLLGIREVRLYDTDPGAMEKLERNLARMHLPGLAVVRCSSTAEAGAKRATECCKRPETIGKFPAGLCLSRRIEREPALRYQQQKLLDVQPSGNRRRAGEKCTLRQQSKAAEISEIPIGDLYPGAPARAVIHNGMRFHSNCSAAHVQVGQ